MISPPRLRRWYKATDFTFPNEGTLTGIKFVGDDGKVIEHEVFKAPGSGVRNGDPQSRRQHPRFRARFDELGLARKCPVYLSTKNTILESL